MIQVLFFVACISTFLVAIFFMIQRKLVGRMLCFFIEEDRSVTPELAPVVDEFIVSRERLYDIFPDVVRVIRYPSGPIWPNWLKQTVPCSLYDRENAIPLDWVTQKPRPVSSKELGAALDPNWLKILVKGAREAGGESTANRLAPLLAAAASIMALLMILVVFSKVGSLESSVAALQKAVGG